jgi:AraC-like DNA-binding protein
MNEQKLNWLKDIIALNQPLYFGNYDFEMHLKNTDCPDQTVFDALLAIDGCQKYLLQQAHAKKKSTPIILSNSIGLMWAANYEMAESVPVRFHVIGPVFMNNVSLKYLHKVLNQLNIPMDLQSGFIRLLHTVPIISLSRLMEYSLMQHYAITGDRLKISDILYQSVGILNANHIAPDKVDRRVSWIIEQQIMKLVEDGNMNFKKEITRLTGGSFIGKLSDGDPTRHSKNTQIIFAALCVRASVRGGLAPEIAYPLGDSYIKNIEACTSMREIIEIGGIMFEDFITRVHRHKKNDGISKSIKDCCEYITFSAEQKIDLDSLAATIGYTKHYLGKKFKQETGLTIHEFINKTKVERAQVMLIDQSQSLQEIGAKLGFESQSYFTKIFKRFIGITPSEYRETL